ncbi:hypothetical protein Tco_1222933 [Tanacetum coccineum]
MLQAKKDLMISIETFLKKFNRISFRETPKVLLCKLGKKIEIKHAQSEEVQELLSKLVQDLQSINEELAEYINTPSWNLPTSSYNDDEEYTIVITPNLSIEEPNNSLSMGDEHLDTIPETESDEVIKSSVEDLVPILSESESIPDNMCDVPFRDNSPPLDISKDQFKGFSDSNNDSTSIDDDSFSIVDIDYVDASPPDYELVSLEAVENVALEDGEIDTDILLIKDDVLHEKLLKMVTLSWKNLKQLPSLKLLNLILKRRIVVVHYSC